ncbi:MAG: hypothetical protein PUP93_31005 [Rhizonema sp. NSF051]|nr:hypothetical protein [Rhizonema sp. NSF051]
MTKQINVAAFEVFYNKFLKQQKDLTPEDSEKVRRLILEKSKPGFLNF